VTRRPNYSPRTHIFVMHSWNSPDTAEIKIVECPPRCASVRVPGVASIKICRSPEAAARIERRTDKERRSQIYYEEASGDATRNRWNRRKRESSDETGGGGGKKEKREKERKKEKKNKKQEGKKKEILKQELSTRSIKSRILNAPFEHRLKYNAQFMRGVMGGCAFGRASAHAFACGMHFLSLSLSRDASA